MGQVGAVGIGRLSVLGVLADWGGAGVKDFSGILNSIVTSWSCRLGICEKRLLCCILKKLSNKINLVVVVHAFNPSTQDAETGSSL